MTSPNQKKIGDFFNKPTGPQNPLPTVLQDQSAIQKASISLPFHCQPMLNIFRPMRWSQWLTFSKETAMSSISAMVPTKPTLIPILYSIIITHSDRDHSGNARSLIQTLGGLREDERPSNFLPEPVRVSLSPMVQWSRDIIENKEGKQLQFFQVNDYIFGIEVTPTSMQLNGDRTFTTLLELCDQAGYQMKYRFNIIKPDGLAEVEEENKLVRKWEDPDSKTKKMNEKWGVEISNDIINRCTHTQNTGWVTNSRYEITNDPTKYGKDMHILVEVLLKNNVLNSNRTFGTTSPPKESIVGPWLRAIHFHEDVGNRVANLSDYTPEIQVNKRFRLSFHDDSLQSIQDIVAETANNNSESFEQRGRKPRIIEFPDLVDSQKPDSLFLQRIPTSGQSEEDEYSIMTAQFNTRGPSFDYQVIGFEDTIIKIFPYTNTPGHYARSFLGCGGEQYIRDFQHLVLQTLSRFQGSISAWSEYANRASIITSFVYDEDPLKVADKDVTSDNPGVFRMLFTGDAYQMDKGPIFKPITNTISSDGNLLNWLWRSQQAKQNTPILVDVLKIPHHGSSVTTDQDFYLNVIASVYLISGGSKHRHPTSQTMETIFKAISKKGAKAPSKFRSADDPNLDLEPIKNRQRPHLIFMTFGVDRRAKKKERSVSPGGRSKSPSPTDDHRPYVVDWLKDHCKWTKFDRPNKDFRLNCRIFVQNKEHATSRLKFGRDQQREDLRVEWEPKDWTELRYDIENQPWNTKNDPVAYPMPGENQPW